jgi:hypothetical protein
MDEWLKILISTMAGLFASLALDPLKNLWQRWKLRKRLYYEIAYMYRALAIGLAACVNFKAENRQLGKAEYAMELVKLITEIQTDFNRALTLEVLESTKTKTPELFYDLKEFPAINQIYGRVKLLKESAAAPDQYEYLLRQAIYAIEKSIYDGTLEGLIMEEAAPPNMKKQVRALIYREKEPMPGKLVVSI